MTELRGASDARFDRLKDVFAASFDAGDELGASVAVTLEGETVVDLHGGFADRQKARVWDDRLLVPVFSAGKAVMALLVARLVDQGRLTYDTRVAETWPEFAQAGKDEITLGELMSHQAGLPGLGADVDPAFWYDPAQVVRALEVLAPAWTPGSASGYHPITIGFLAGEVFRRTDGRTLARALREDLAEPFGLDLWWGLPDALHERTPQMWKPNQPPFLGELDDHKRAAFYRRGASPGRDTPEWRRAEFPSANLHANARSLARALVPFANGGRLDGAPVLSPSTVREALRERIVGPDKVLPFRISWAAGVMRNEGLDIFGPEPSAVGHCGWGGSCVLADPVRRVTVAYAMNKQSPHLLGDPRPVKLIEAIYAAL